MTALNSLTLFNINLQIDLGKTTCLVYLTKSGISLINFQTMLDIEYFLV